MKIIISRSYCVLAIQLVGMIFLSSATASDNLNQSLALPKSASESTLPQKNRSVTSNPAKPKHYTVSQKAYQIPDITLSNANGEKIQIVELLDDQQPVLLQFIFSTCATICPVLSASFASAQDKLKQTNANYRMVSISIDPDEDTPRKLEAYAKRFNAHKQWHFLTGSRANVAKVQRAFDAYYPGNNKMYHQPYTFMRPQGTKIWTRIDGLMSSANLVEEYQKLLSPSVAARIEQGVKK